MSTSNPMTEFLRGMSQAHAETNQKKERQLALLTHLSTQIDPAYADDFADLIGQTEMAKGNKDLKQVMMQFHNMAAGLNPKTKTTEISGYQGAGAQNNAMPAAPTSSPISDNISSVLNNPNVGNAPAASPVDMMLKTGAGASPFAPATARPPMQGAPVSLVGGDDIQGGGLMGQPSTGGGVGLVGPGRTGPLVTPISKPGFKVEGRIPLIEDPVARKLREQNALNPGLIDLYRGKTDVTTQSKIQINRAKIDDQLDKDLALIDPKMKAQVKAYATRGVMKRIADLGGDPTNPDDVKEATTQLTSEIKQNYDEHTQRIQKMKDDAAGLKRKLDDADKNYELKKQELDLKKTTAANTQDWRSQQTRLAQIKRDVDSIKVRHAAAQRDLERIGRDPRLLNPEKYPEVAQQLQKAEDNLRKIEDDLQSAAEGDVGGAQAAREAAKGEAAGAPKSGGKKTTPPKNDPLGLFTGKP